MSDWSALEDAAASMRRLNRAVAAFHASSTDLRDLARIANELAERLELGDPRSKQYDVGMLPFVAASASGRLPATAVGDVLEFDPLSLGGGRLHPSSIGIEFRRDGAASVAARATVHGMFQGPAGRVHGGVVALIIDELMGAVNRVVARRAFTARLQVHLRAPAPVDAELAFRAWEDSVDGRKITIRAEGRADGNLFVEADALFVEAVDHAYSAAEAPPGR